MHTDTELLRSIAEDLAARQNPDPIYEPKADHRLILEANRLEKAIIQALRTIDNHVQRDTFRNDTIGKLVNICDLLYDVHHKVSPDTKVLLDLLTAVKTVLPNEISPVLRLPKAFVHTQKELVKTQWQEFEGILRKYQVSAELVTIAAIPFRRFIDSKEKLYWGDYTWLKGYAAKLDAVDWDHADCNSPAEALMSLLIGRDFNHDQFYIYCKKYIQERVQQVKTKQGKLQEYAVCQKLVQEDTQTGLPSFNRHDNALSPRLLKLIREETEALKTAAAYEDAPQKVEFNWDADTSAVFYKYLMDKGITKKVETKTYAKQIAATISTVGKDDVQWDTFHKRFYSKDEKYLNRIYEPLNSILEDIKFFLRK
jgi:hypothetical protein